MRWLKASVIVMGILIVAGTAAIAVMLAMRADDGAGDDSAAGGGAVSGEAARLVLPATGAARLVLPAGARVVETALDGDRIALRIALEGGGERVVVIDARTGRRIGAVDVVPAGAGAEAKPDP